MLREAKLTRAQLFGCRAHRGDGVTSLLYGGLHHFRLFSSQVCKAPGLLQT